MSDQESSIFVAILLATIFLIVSVIIFIVEGCMFKSYMDKVKKGDKVTGTITSTIVEQDFIDDAYRIFVTVRYEYNGITYNSDRFQTGIKYKEGKKIKLYVNKDNPTDFAFLDIFTYSILTTVGLVFLIVSIGLFYLSVRIR